MRPARFHRRHLPRDLPGTLATLIYHVRHCEQSRQNYVHTLLAQAEVVTLERTLEIHRRGSTADLQQPIHDPSRAGEWTIHRRVPTDSALGRQLRGFLSRRDHFRKTAAARRRVLSVSPVPLHHRPPLDKGGLQGGFGDRKLNVVTLS